MNFALPQRRLCSAWTVVLIFITAVATAVSALIIRVHLEQVTEVRNEVAPLAVQIVPLKRRVEVLEEQLEIARLHEETRVGSLEETFRSVVLPEKDPMARMLAAVDFFRAMMNSRAMIRNVGPVRPGSSTPLTEAGMERISARPVTLTFEAAPGALSLITAFLRMPGVLVTEDALSPSAVALLVSRTEAENPAALAAVEQFLRTDALAHCLDVKAHEDRLLRAFSDPVFPEFLKSTLKGSLLETLCSSFPRVVFEAMQKENIWPLPAAEIRILRLENIADGWTSVTVTFDVMSRRKAD